ncbi:alanine racemase [Microbacterium sp. SD291]|uniref:alanine racemase n=1 Tax=Microbacterium sp. SD291 TaxID=2782007 RepID=UPI001A95755D|nr:alanine racemase [Microbacterium sp. SD291]MBO0982175.1 alanine racemase [Microbacterium sp. SD291]
MTAPFREAVIDLDAISDNVRHFRKLTGVEVIGVVKANAYGHGAAAAAVAALAGGATRLGVAEISEALELRRSGITAPIVAWLHAPGERFEQAAAQSIEVGISSFDQLEAAAIVASVDHPVGVHLKLETGLSRNGIAPADWRRVLAEAARLERIGRLRIVGLFSHLSNTSVEDDREALAKFEEGVAAAASFGIHPEIRHIAATAAAIDLPEMRLDAVRIGIGLYGLSPFDDRSSAELGLRPAMTLRGAIAAVRRVPAGSGVSYGYDHRTDRPTTLVLVPLGYADGVPRQASGRLPVSIGGRRFTNVGRIAMDQFVVDVGDHPVSVGDEVVLFGDPTLGVPSAAEWGNAAGTINYEIVTRIGQRVHRRSA